MFNLRPLYFLVFSIKLKQKTRFEAHCTFIIKNENLLDEVTKCNASGHVTHSLNLATVLSHVMWNERKTRKWINLKKLKK